MEALAMKDQKKAEDIAAGRYNSCHHYLQTDWIQPKPVKLKLPFVSKQVCQSVRCVGIWRSIERKDSVGSSPKQKEGNKKTLFLNTRRIHEDIIYKLWIYIGCCWTSNLICCLLYTSDAADEEDSVDLGGRRIIKKKKKKKKKS